MQELLTPKTLATALGLAEQTIYNRHSSGGDLPPCIKLGRLLRFRQADVDAWLTSRSAPEGLRPAPAGTAGPKRRGRPTKAEQVAARRAH
ncbi:helix-turn-helix domain-containing protein [Paraburkholderia agricolaris]|uniref:Helix-turn-helix domain-containing protein n=1 Tax=Paraburkholderia agricolaris TaxID=2152888 RepID=A0ABW8ZQ42_9BURK